MEAVTEDAKNLPDGVAEVEWCATDLSARGKGIASKLFLPKPAILTNQSKPTTWFENPKHKIS